MKLWPLALTLVGCGLSGSLSVAPPPDLAMDSASSTLDLAVVPAHDLAVELATTTDAATVPSCPAPMVLCSGACADTSSDVQSCGACGRACAGTEGCEDGYCQAVVAVGVDRALAVRDGYVYFKQAGQIMRVAMAGGHPEVIASTPLPYADAIAANSSAVFVADRDDGTGELHAYSLTEGTDAFIAYGAFFDVAADGGALYYLDRNAAEVLETSALDGSERRTLSTGEGTLYDFMTANSTDLFVKLLDGSTTAIARGSKTGGALTTVTPPDTWVATASATDQWLYWCTDTAVERTALDGSTTVQTIGTVRGQCNGLHAEGATACWVDYQSSVKTWSEDAPAQRSVATVVGGIEDVVCDANGVVYLAYDQATEQFSLMHPY